MLKCRRGGAARKEWTLISEGSLDNVVSFRSEIPKRKAMDCSVAERGRIFKRQDTKKGRIRYQRVNVFAESCLCLPVFKGNDGVNHKAEQPPDGRVTMKGTYLPS